MASVTIRNLSEETKGLLAQRASRRRHSLEEELRQILDEAARAEVGNPDALEADLTAAAADGFRAVVLARVAFRSWPGLSEKGLLLVSGAVPGPANGYIIVKDASKRARHKDAPYPAGLRKAAAEAAAPAADAAPQA